MHSKVSITQIWRSFQPHFTSAARPPYFNATLRHHATPSGMLRLIKAQIYASWDDDWRVS